MVPGAGRSSSWMGHEWSRLVDGSSKPTAPRLKIETGRRCKNVVVSILNTSSNCNSRRELWENENENAVCQRFVMVCW